MPRPLARPWTAAAMRAICTARRNRRWMRAGRSGRISHVRGARVGMVGLTRLARAMARTVSMKLITRVGAGHAAPLRRTPMITRGSITT